VQPSIIPFQQLATNRPFVPPGVASLAAALRREVPPQGRFAFAHEDEFRRSFDIPHPEMWIARLSGRNTVVDLGGNSVSWFDNFIVDHVWDTNWDTVSARLSRAGVTHLLVSPDRRSTMRAHTDFAEVFHNAFGAIYRRLPIEGHPSPASLAATTGAADIELRHAAPESYEWAKGSDAPVDVTLGIGYFEKWAASFDGRELTPFRTLDGLLGVHLPAGTGTLHVRFERDAGDWVGALVTLATLIALIGATRRRRRREGSGLVDDDGVDGEIGDRTVAAGGGDALGRLEHVEACDQLAEQ
jgi:hypothetical protein